MVISRKRALVIHTGSSSHEPATRRKSMEDEREGSRPGPKRKLPKMNPSERAKYYRRRVREYMNNLEEADSDLAREVATLELLQNVQLQVSDITTPASRQQLLAHVWEFMDTKQYLAQHRLDEPSFDVHSVDVVGAADGLVLRLCGEVRGSYSQDTIEKDIYPFIPGNSRLLDKLMRSTFVFNSSFRFFFATDGSLTQQTSETDFVAGLQASTACSVQELRQLLRALGDPEAVHSAPNADAPAPTLEFLQEDAQPR